MAASKLTKADLVEQVRRLQARITELERGSAVESSAGTLIQGAPFDSQRRFRDKLAELIRISNRLTASASLDDLCRQAVELGRERLGFDRLSIWFLSEDRLTLLGMFGTDEQGHTRDERGRCVTVQSPTREYLQNESTFPSILTGEKIRNDRGEVLRPGRCLMAPMWDSEHIIGIVFSDNYLRGAPLTPDDDELLAMYAATIGHLCARKRAEAALADSESLMRAFLDNGEIVAWMKDAQGRYVYISPNYERRFGVHLSDWRGKTDFDVWPRPVAEVFRRHDQAVLAAKRPLEAVEEAPDTDGSRSWWLVSKFPYQDASGNWFVGGLGVNISARKQAEANLRESEERFRLMAESSLLGICIFQDRKFKYANPALAGMLGYTVEELLTIEGLRLVHPEDQPDVAERLRRRLEGELQADRYMCRLVRKSGELIEIEALGRRIMFEGRPAIVSTIQDVTQRRRAEEELRASEAKYRAFIEITDTGAVIIDGEGRVLDANQEYVRLTGHRTLEEIAGRKVMEWTAPHDAVRNAEEVRNCLARGFVRNLTLDYIDAEGRITPIEINATVLESDRGLRIMGICRDISQRKQAEQEREHLQAQLRQSQKMEAVGRLSGGIAHDFNNLLTVIEGNTQIALMQLEPNKVKQGAAKAAAAIAEIQRAAERAALLTNQLLTFSRKQVTQVKTLDVTAIVRNMEKMLRRLIREDIAIRIACGPGEHLIHGDTGQIEQVLINLVVNAGHAMPEGGELTITVASEMLDSRHLAKHHDARPGLHVVITVADTGCGMDQETLDHLFEPFFTTKPFGEGTGLGLSIVYGIVYQSGGHIDVRSEPGRGTTFKLYFPCVQGEPADAQESLPPNWERGSETVLLCEDEVALRRLAASVLTECGYTVIEAENGEQAVQLAADYAGLVQLLVTDVVMPGMKGDKVAAVIHQDQPDVGVLFMSGYASDVLNIERLRRGEVEFLQKPFKPETLLRRVREVLDKVPRRSHAAD